MPEVAGFATFRTLRSSRLGRRVSRAFAFGCSPGYRWALKAKRTPEGKGLVKMRTITEGSTGADSPRAASSSSGLEQGTSERSEASVDPRHRGNLERLDGSPPEFPAANAPDASQLSEDVVGALLREIVEFSAASW
jgi:hypothetical protein